MGFDRDNDFDVLQSSGSGIGRFDYVSKKVRKDARTAERPSAVHRAIEHLLRWPR